jgi:hypothetical protein
MLYTSAPRSTCCILAFDKFVHVSAAAPVLTVPNQQRMHGHRCWLHEHLAQLAQLAGKVQRSPAVIVVQVGVGTLQYTANSSSSQQRQWVQ